MNRWRLPTCFFLLLLSLTSSPAGTLVRFKTTVGSFDVELFDTDKPLTVRNFLRYLQSGFYTNNLIMHRAVPNFVIQGGGIHVTNRGAAGETLAYIPTFPPVVNEFRKGKFYSNVYGTIAMAKTADPNSATSQFFVNLADNSSSLDDTNNSGGFTVFGRVIAGTNVLNQLNLASPNAAVKKVNLGGILSELPVVSTANLTNIQYSDLVYVEVTFIPPEIAQQPQSQTLLPGQTATFTVKASGTAPLKYQWRFQGKPITGATSSVYTRANVQTANVGAYSVVVSNRAGMVTSADARLDVPPVKGTYTGLLLNTNANDVTFDNSGFFTATVLNKGAFAARLQAGSNNTYFTGQFLNTGFYSNSVARRGLSPLSVQLQLDLAGNDLLTGQISDGTWTAPLLAHRTVSSPSNAWAGKYTLVIPRGENFTNEPGGYGFGTVSVDGLGRVSFSGMAGDGTVVTQKTVLSKQGQWPFYASLYSRKGSILGWLSFATNSSQREIEGPLTWFKLPQSAAKLYPAGLVLRAEAAGVQYTPPPTGGQVLPFTQGELLLEGGNLAAGLTNVITVGAYNRITGTNKLSVAITASTGRFKGSLLNPGTGKTSTLNGVVLQDRKAGFGCLVGTNQTGSVYFGSD